MTGQEPAPRRTGAVVREVAPGGRGWSGITWSDLAGPAEADAAIAAQVRYFGALGLPFEWKLYDYDQPSDLGGRLTAAGFVPDEDEAVMVAEVADVPADVTLPEGVTLRPVTTEADVGLLIGVHERVFGRDKSRLRQDLLAQLREAPQSVAMVLAMAGDEPVCSARVGLPAGLGVRRAVGRRDAARLARPRHLPRPDRLPGRAGRPPGLPLPDRGRLRRQRADPAPAGLPVPGPDHALPVGPGGSRMTTTGVAVVTGAGSGLGREIARALLGAGWRVAAAGRREDALREAVSGPGLPAGARAALPVVTDVTEPGSVAGLFETVRGRWGRVNLLVNNAGIFGPGGAVDEVSVQDWRRAVDTNLTGAFLCAQQAVRMMKEQDPRGGRIINNGSISAHVPRPKSVAYTATKHAMTGLTKSISLDGRAFGIACGQIDIGNAATEMTARMEQGVLQADGSVAPEPTFGAEHVAAAVLYMAGLPLDANVQFLTITATTMPFIGRG